MNDITSIFQFVRFLFNTASFQNAASVTPSDTEDMAKTASALWVWGTGNLKVDLEGEGEGITFNSLPVGLFRARVKRVYATGTSASNIVGMW